MLIVKCNNFIVGYFLLYVFEFRPQKDLGIYDMLSGGRYLGMRSYVPGNFGTFTLVWSRPMLSCKGRLLENARRATTMIVYVIKVREENVRSNELRI